MSWLTNKLQPSPARATAILVSCDSTATRRERLLLPTGIPMPASVHCLACPPTFQVVVVQGAPQQPRRSQTSQRRYAVQCGCAILLLPPFASAPSMPPPPLPSRLAMTSRLLALCCPPVTAAKEARASAHCKQARSSRVADAPRRRSSHGRFGAPSVRPFPPLFVVQPTISATRPSTPPFHLVQPNPSISGRPSLRHLPWPSSIFNLAAT